MALHGRNNALNDVIDNVNCLIEYESGVVGSFWWSKVALGYRNGLQVRVFGTEGALEWLQTSPEVILFSKTDGSKRIVERGSQEALILSKQRYSRMKAGHPSGFIEAFANLYFDLASELIEDHKVMGEYVAHCQGENVLRGMKLLTDIHVG